MLFLFISADKNIPKNPIAVNAVTPSDGWTKIKNKGKIIRRIALTILFISNFFSVK